jgi:hypothetical protein
MTAIGSDSIKDLLSTAGPCITIVSAAEKLPEAIQNVRKLLRERGEESEALLAALLQEVPDVEADGKNRGLVAILRAPGLIRVVQTGPDVKPIVKVNDRFDVRTLLAIGAAETTFHILALSQKHTRILECTQHGCRETPYPAGYPTSLDDSKDTDRPDHDLDNRSGAGPDMGGMKGVMFGTSTDREKKDEYLLHFFSSVNKAVHLALKDHSSPLVVVAVESELALYRRINTYPGVLEPGVHGSPDGMEGGEVHRRALELLRSRPPAATVQALGDFDKKVGTGHASTRIQDIVAAAFEGRVSQLFFQENAKYEGTFDAMRQRVKHSDPDDLIEEAAYQTIMHKGEARTIPASAMPNGVAVCALFRYPSTQAA